MAAPGALMTSMRYVDLGYAIVRDDIKTSITWDQLEAHLYEGNYFELLNEYNNSQFSFPYETEVELGDSVIVMTNRYFNSGNSFTTRVARFGDFAYASDGRMLSANIYREYYMHEGSGDLWGDVLDYGEDGYLISDMLTIDEEEKHGEYKSDNIEALQVHAFRNDEDYLGRGRSAFQEDEASKYFRDDWHLDPFGNNFVSVETDSKNLILQYKGNEYLLGTVFGTFSELKDVLVDDPWWHQNQDTTQGLAGPDELVNQVVINAGREWFDVSNDLSYDNYYSQYGGGNDLPVFAVLHSNQQSTVGVKWLHDQGHVIGDNAQLGAEHFYLTSTLLGRIGSFVEGEGDKVFHVNSKPSGLPLLTGNFTVGQRIALDTSEIDDADNSEGWTPSYEYSWEVSGDNGTTWTELTSTDATDSDDSYTLTPAEAGKQLRGVVGYRDGYGTTELIKALALTVNALPEPVTQNIDLWVSAGSFEAPYYRFYADAEGSQELTAPVLDTSKSYTFRRLNEATSHPFFISDSGFKQSSSDALIITGDGSPFQGITGDESFKVEFTDLVATTEELLYYCSSHSSMQRTLDLIDGSIDLFQVADVRQVASGLALKLSEAPDLEKLNLYDGNDDSVDLPDLQLIGSDGIAVEDLSLHWKEESSELFLIQKTTMCLDNSCVERRSKGFLYRSNTIWS